MKDTKEGERTDLKLLRRKSSRRLGIRNGNGEGSESNQKVTKSLEV